ncbi:MAG: tetratricopeptide repeat protein [Kofleriaceae bacterium]|nr:tetratricopeptide repeat protein [Kofleriaceae bacterium]
MKKHHSLVLALTCTFLGALLALPPLGGEQSAQAQDDWNVRRDPFDKGLISRHKRALRKRPGDGSSLSKLMGMYRRYRSVGQLIREYESAQKKTPHFSNLMILGHLYRHEKKPKEALGYFKQAAEQKPQDSGANLALGKLYQDDGDANTARSYYAKALKSAKKKASRLSILRALADLSVRAGDIEKAKSYFQELISLDPKNRQLQLELGEALAQFKRFDEAIVIYRDTEKHLRADPMMRIEVITRIGAALIGKGEDMKAVAEYERGIKLVKSGYYLGKELTLRIVEIYRRRQELETLIQKFEKNWKGKSRGHFEWDTLGKLYEETGKPDKAVAAYRSATKKAPYELDTHRRLIVLLENSGQEQLALKQYEAVIRVAPGEPRFQLELAKRYWKNGNAKKAMAMAKKIESHFASDGGVVSALADMYSAWNKMDRAMAAYQKLVRIEPGDMQHIENLGEQYFQRGDKKKAQQIWKKLGRIKNVESYSRLAQVYFEHDMLPDSLAMYNKAIRLAPKNATLFKGRAHVYERTRSWTQSVADWEKVLSLSPDKASYQSIRREARRRVVNILQRARGSLLTRRIAEWKSGFEKSPPDIGAGHYLVHAYSRTQQFTKVTKTLEKLLSLRPSDIDVMQQLVKMYRVYGKHNEAVELLLTLAELSPGSERDYYTQIAEIKTDLQQDGEAIEYVRKALEKSPNDPVAY